MRVKPESFGSVVKRLNPDLYRDYDHRMVSPSTIVNQVELSPAGLIAAGSTPQRKSKRVYASELDRLNKTERRFYERVRDGLSDCAKLWPGDVLYIQTFTLRLSDSCRYTPDFTLVFLDGKINHYEIKGSFIWSKAMNKPKMAANKFPQHAFWLCQWKGGAWTETRLQP